MKAYGYEKMEFHALLNSALNGGEYLHAPTDLPKVQGYLVPHCVGDSVGGIVGLEAVVMTAALLLPPHLHLVMGLRIKRICTSTHQHFLYTCRESNPDSLVVKHVA